MIQRQEKNLSPHHQSFKHHIQRQLARWYCQPNCCLNKTFFGVRSVQNLTTMTCFGTSYRLRVEFLRSDYRDSYQVKWFGSSFCIATSRLANHCTIVSWKHSFRVVHSFVISYVTTQNLAQNHGTKQLSLQCTDEFKPMRYNLLSSK